MPTLFRYKFHVGQGNKESQPLLSYLGTHRKTMIISIQYKDIPCFLYTWLNPIYREAEFDVCFLWVSASFAHEDMAMLLQSRCFTSRDLQKGC